MTSILLKVNPVTFTLWFLDLQEPSKEKKNISGKSWRKNLVKISSLPHTIEGII